MRIVSLIPEATEILQALGLGDQIVEIPHPPAPSPLRERGGESTPPLSRKGEGAGGWGELRPDLIFTSETEAGGGVPRATVRRAVVALRPRPAVYALEPHSLGEILSDVKTVGDATGRQGQARRLIETLRERIDTVSLRAAQASLAAPLRRVVCLQSTDPLVAAGSWLAELIGLAGGLDALDGVGRPPRAVTWEQIQAAQPDLVIDLSAQAGPGAVALLEQLAARILPQSAGLRSEG